MAVQQELKMDEQHRQLIDYIKEQMAQGHTSDTIRATLLQHGWPTQLVDQSLQAAQTSSSPAPTPTSTPAQQSFDSSSGLVAATQKYKVFRAITDTFKAIRNNVRGFLLATLISYGVVGGLLTLFIILTALLFVPFISSPPSVPQLLTAMGVGVIIYTAVYAVAGAFTMSTVSLALSEGIASRKSSLSAIFSGALARLWRVVVANALFAVIVALPMVVASLIPIVMLVAGGTGGSSTSLILGPILILVAVVWMIVALLRFALVPYVALFEPNVPLTKTLSRSSHLLKQGGQWFLVKGVLLIFGIFILIAAISGQSLAEVSSSPDLLPSIVLIVISIGANGALVMLYHNRRAVKDGVGVTVD